MRVAMTGAASGIGAAVLKRMQAAGHEVTAFDVADPGTDAHWIEVDLSDPDAVRAAAAGARGPFDALILNAGLPPRADNAAQVLAVNVFGVTVTAEALADHLAPGASIVATASRAGERWRENLDEVKAVLALEGPDALPGFIAARDMDPLRAYCLSKEAVVVWTQRQTGPLLQRGMRVNCVSPSAVDTPILDDFVSALGERAQKALALLGRAASADEIAALIAFLASPDSEWVRGQNITVDGGLSAMVLTEALDL